MEHEAIDQQMESSLFIVDVINVWLSHWKEKIKCSKSERCDDGKLMDFELKWM